MYKSALFFCLVFLGCGKTSSPYDEPSVQKFVLRQKGYYRAPLLPVNSRHAPKVEGMASFFINDIQFYAKVRLQTPWKLVDHFQMLHMGGHCPTPFDDVNGDGVVDGLEAMAVVGKILVPLDYDIRTQLAKFTVQPTSNISGKYIYSQSASSRLVLADLRSRDPFPLDFIAKLDPWEEINFEERLVVIYGIPKKSTLPESAEGFEGLPAHLSFPIACGSIRETAETFP